MEEEEQSAPDLAAEHPASAPTPRSHVDSKPLPTDSLVTISLSDANRTSSSTTCLDSTILSAPEAEIFNKPQHRSSVDIINGLHDDEDGAESPALTTPADSVQSPNWERSSSPSPPLPRHSHSSSSRNSREDSDPSIEVDWEELDKTEEREDADAENDEVSIFAKTRIGSMLTSTGHCAPSRSARTRKQRNC